MKQTLYLFLLLNLFTFPAKAQSLWTVSDPDGNEVLIDRESSFLSEVNGLILFYTCDNSQGVRNILVTDGSSSYWLFDTGFSMERSFTRFITRNSDELLFGIGDQWYLTKGTPETTQVFYDNNAPGSLYNYLRISEFLALNIAGNNLAIEAENKESGDTVTLYHNTEFETTNLLSRRYSVLKDNLEAFGSINGSFFVGSEFDYDSKSWSQVGYYRELQGNAKQLVALTPKAIYNTNGNYGKLVDHQEDGTKFIYQYTSDQDTFLDITQTIFPGYVPLEYQSLKWLGYGFPHEPPLSNKDYYFKGRNGFGQIRYFTTDVFGDLYEIEDLRGAEQVDFIHSEYANDSIYYYNFDEEAGLSRYNLFNKGTVKDPSPVSFDPDFRLKGFLGRLYYGRYNPESGSIEASVIDNPEGGNIYYLESSAQERIENPVDFEFLDDKVFVYSRTSEGLKLVVYDPDGVVSIPKVDMMITSHVSPNPSWGFFQVRLNDFRPAGHFQCIVMDMKGNLVFQKNVAESDFAIDISGVSTGMYPMSVVTHDGRLVSSALLFVK